MAVRGLSASAAAGSTCAEVSTSTAVSPEALENLVECPICFCRLDSKSDPRALPCLHTFCRRCLVSYQKQLKVGRKLPKSLPCPFCRREAQLPLTGISGLPRNFLTCQISDALKQSTKQAKSTARTSQRESSRIQPSAPSLPAESSRLEPSAPLLSEITSDESRVRNIAPVDQTKDNASDSTNSSSTSTARPTSLTVQMRRHPDDSTRRSLPRPSSDPLLSPDSPIIPPRRRFGQVASTGDEDYSWGSLGRNSRKKDVPSFLSTMIGSFLSATR